MSEQDNEARVLALHINAAVHEHYQDSDTLDVLVIVAACGMIASAYCRKLPDYDIRKMTVLEMSQQIIKQVNVPLIVQELNS